MGKKPTLGHASLSAAIVALRNQQYCTREIASLCKTSIENVYALEHTAARKLVVVRVPVVTMAALAPHAERRNMHPNDLIRSLLRQAVDDQLVDAILDDAPAEDAA